MSRLAAMAAVVALAVVTAPAPALAQGANGDLERQRLDLDIKRLKREAGFWDQVQRWLPAGSALAAFLVAGYGIRRYYDERDRAREHRTEDEIARNIERLIDGGEANANARAVAALESLDRRAPQASKDARDRRHREQVTEVVRTIVLDDLLELRTVEEARRPVICLAWAEFDAKLRAQPELAQAIVGRYLAALQAIAGRHRLHVAHAVREGGQIRSPEGRLTAADAWFLLAVVDGCERLVAMLPDGPERDGAIATFTATAPRLGTQLFASSG